MSKQYKLDMNIDTTGFTPSGGFLLYNVDRTVADSGHKERTGAEIFVMFAKAAMEGANQRVSYDELKGFRSVAQKIQNAVEAGLILLNKSELDTIKHSIKGNKWPNNYQCLMCLELMLKQIEDAKLEE